MTQSQLPHEGNVPVTRSRLWPPPPVAVFWLNLCMVTFVYWEVDWGNHNFYRHDPWLNQITPELVEHFATWLAGFFIVSFSVALKKGKIDAFFNPGPYMDGEAYNILMSRRTTIVMVIAASIVYVMINHRKVYHLVYAEEDAPPIVEINSRVRQFRGNEIPWIPPAGEEHKIAVRDPYDLYRVDLDESKADSHPLFLNHFFVDLHPYYLRKDFQAVFRDSEKNTKGTLDYRFGDNTDITDAMCAEQNFRVSDCKGLIQKVFRKVYDPQQGFPPRADGPVQHSDQNYRFTFENENEMGLVRLELESHPVKSEWIIYPDKAFESYRDMAASARDAKLQQFRDEMATATTRRTREWVYSMLWNSALREDLNSLQPAASRLDALGFVRSTLAGSEGDLTDNQLLDILREIQKTNLDALRTETDVAKIAVETICTLIKNRSLGVRREGIKFVADYVSDLKDRTNRIKPDLTASLLSLVHEDSDREDLEQILAIVAKLYNYSSAKDKVRDKVHARRDELPADLVRCQLDWWLQDPKKYQWTEGPCAGPDV
jgi:hypothetical protein